MLEDDEVKLEEMALYLTREVSECPYIDRCTTTTPFKDMCEACAEMTSQVRGKLKEAYKLGWKAGAS